MAATNPLTAVENKIISVSSLVIRTYYNTQINKIKKKITDFNHNDNITTPEFNTSTAKNFAARLIQANLASKRYIAYFVNETDFDNQVKKCYIKLKWIKLPIKKNKAISTNRLTKDLIYKFSIINGAKYFSLGIFQNYLVFIPAIKYFKWFHDTTQVYLGKANGISEESTENITKSDSNFAPTFVDHHSLPDMNTVK